MILLSGNRICDAKTKLLSFAPSKALKTQRVTEIERNGDKSFLRRERKRTIIKQAFIRQRMAIDIRFKFLKNENMNLEESSTRENCRKKELEYNVW